MLSFSDNVSTCALIKALHDHAAVDGLNRRFAELGLDTLQLRGTDPGTGGRWRLGEVTMTALHTAKLLLVVHGSPGVLWHDSLGRAVTRRVLSEASRVTFRSMLAQQGYNEVLSTVNPCAPVYPARGIPHTLAPRWVAADGTVTWVATLSALTYARVRQPRSSLSRTRPG